MQILTILLVQLLTFASASSRAQDSSCYSKYSPETNQLVRQFMIDNHLILQSEEVDLPLFNIKTTWELSFTIEHNSNCLAVMALCEVMNGTKTCDLAYDVFSLVIDKKNKKTKVILFEESIPVPKKIIAKVGSQPDFSTREDSSYYFVEFSDRSTIEAFKAITTGIIYSGFSGVVRKTGKHEFDPTPLRTWKVTEPQFSLRRGKTSPELDIQAYQLDGLDGNDANEFWNNCVKLYKAPDTCQVSPWFQSYIIDIFPSALNN